MPPTYAFQIVSSFDDFERLRLSARSQARPLLLYAHGPACSICMTGKAEDAVAAKFGAQVELVKMSVANVPELDEKLGIATIPTLLLFLMDQEGQLPRKYPSTPDASGAKVVRWLKGELP